MEEFDENSVVMYWSALNHEWTTHGSWNTWTGLSLKQPLKNVTIDWKTVRGKETVNDVYLDQQLKTLHRWNARMCPVWIAPVISRCDTMSTQQVWDVPWQN